MDLGDDWDDSELIRAYDKAVKNWRKNKKEEGGESQSIGPWVPVPVPVKKDQEEDGVEVQRKNNLLMVGSWVLGSPCRAVWSEDGLEYEAKIVGIEGPKCTIRFVGYGNQEMKELSELRETFGKRSRDRQRREAQTANSSQYLSTGLPFERDGEDYFSSVSLTSSMCNNCPSITNEGDRDDQVHTTSENPASVSTSSACARKSPNKKDDCSTGKRKRDDEVDSMIVEVDQDQDHTTLDADRREFPSGAEATMGSSSSSSISAEENGDGDDEATSAAGGFGESFKKFPNMIPQFPVPPMPMSLADADGKFDFGRGQLPSLLLSWYMSGYHAGYFDAKREVLGHPKPKGQDESSKNRSKRQ